jgi:electron transport complex protein RnfC
MFGKARVASFRHGVHPDEAKEATAGLPVERMPFVDEYVLTLDQHIGKPARPLVAPGQRVERGSLVAKPDGWVSVGIHAPVTGTVKAIELRPASNGKMARAIVIATDPYDSQELRTEAPPAASGLGHDEFARRVQESGLVGLGGAAFPSHVKLKVPEGKRAEFLILNGCECEPYLTCDHRVMLERPDAVIAGLDIIAEKLGVERAYIGVESNKLDAVEALRARLSADRTVKVEVVPLAVTYPQGAEKMLIDAVLQREVPAGGLPIDVEVVSHNVGTAAALADLFATGAPLIERVVTVTGDGVVKPGNLLVPIGTPIQAVIDYCGGLKAGARQVILGGPMMGHAQKDLRAPVSKGVSGILVLESSASVERPEQPCIRCGRCLDACPMFLNPSRLAALVRAEAVESLSTYHQLDCFECASCSFVCPSSIPLVQLMRVGKAMVRDAAARERAKQAQEKAA